MHNLMPEHDRRTIGTYYNQIPTKNGTFGCNLATRVQILLKNILCNDILSLAAILFQFGSIRIALIALITPTALSLKSQHSLVFFV
jgi:hypothetical protein